MTTRAVAFTVVCFFPCGRSTLMALGETIVLVIIKKMSRRNIMSVIDAMLNVGLTFVLRLNIGSLPFAYDVHECERLCFNLVHHTINLCHQIVVAEECHNADSKTAHRGDHGLIDAT